MKSVKIMPLEDLVPYSISLLHSDASVYVPIPQLYTSSHMYIEWTRKLQAHSAQYFNICQAGELHLL